MKWKHLLSLAAVLCLVSLWIPVSAMSQETSPAPDTSKQSSETPQSSQAPYPKIGVALAGGGARGFAHIGVLRVLEEAGIPIDFIAGTSMGSIIGGLYAAGYSLDELEQVITEVNWDDIFSDTPPRKLWSFLRKRQSSKYLFGVGFTKNGFVLPVGLTKGQKVSTLFSFLTIPVSEIEDFDQLPIPFRAVAADIVTGEEVVLDHGSLAEAMRASMSIPGVFTPAKIEGRLLVDGGIVKNFPVDVVRAMGADIVIGVDISSALATEEQLGNPFAVLNQMVGIQIQKITQEQRELADLVIHPDLGSYTAASFGNGAEIVELGEQGARLSLDELQALAETIRATRPAGRAVPLSLRKQFEDLYIEDVTLTGDVSSNIESTMHKYFQQQKDVALDPDLIGNAVETLFSTGHYETVNFALKPGSTENGRVLNLDLQQKPVNPHLLRFGMYYEGRYGDSEPDKMVLLLNATLNDLTGQGSFWSTDLQFVNVNKLQTRYFQPVGKGIFLLPEAYDNDDFQVIYNDQEPVARYDFDETGASFYIGTLLSRLGLLMVGYNLESANVKPSVDLDPDLFPRFDETLSSLLAYSTFDRLDTFPFPHSGVLLEIDYQWANDQLGGDVNFHKLLLDFWQLFPLAKKHTLGLRVKAGSDFRSGLPPYKDFLLGGRDSFVGYKIEEIRGAHLGIAGLEYRYQVAKLPTPIGGDIYLTAIGNVGNAWRHPG